MGDLRLPQPPGYRSLVPFDKEKHRNLGVCVDGYGFAAGLHVIPLLVPEFFQAARFLPIVFGKDPASRQYFPAVLTSLTVGANLLVDGQGRWSPGVYIPAFLRRYPFLTVEVRGAEVSGEPRFLLCVDEQALCEDGAPLFDARGEPAAEWRRVESFANDMIAAQRQTTLFVRSLEQAKLLEPFEAQANARSGEQYRLRSLFRVNEDKLNRLPGKAVKDFMSRGELSRIYAHLMSLDNFAGLLDRSVDVGARTDRA